MLIIGFASEYYDLYNSSNRKSQYAVDAINLFIDSGKSVLFSNDTTSFVNVSPHHSFKDGHLTSFSDDWKVPRQWGYYMNNAFRNVMAMDLLWGFSRHGYDRECTDAGTGKSVKTAAASDC